MRIIHCTQKLLKELDVPIIEPYEAPLDSRCPGNWYANLIRVDRGNVCFYSSTKFSIITVPLLMVIFPLRTVLPAGGSL